MNTYSFCLCFLKMEKNDPISSDFSIAEEIKITQ